MAETPKTAFESYLQTFVRRKFTFLGVFLVCAVGLGLLSLTISPAYRTTSRLAIADITKMPMPDFLDVYLPGASAMSLAGDTYVALLEGLPMADLIADRLSREGIFVNGKTVAFATKAEFFDPDLIEITATAPDSSRAIALANAAAEVFVDENRNTIKREMSRAIDFITYELGVSEEEWLTAQQELAEMRANPDVGYLEQRLDSYFTQIKDYEASINGAAVDIGSNKARREKLESMLGAESVTFLSPMEDPVIKGLQDQLVKLIGQQAAKEGEFGPDHPEVKILRAQREELERQMKARADRLTAERFPLGDEEYLRELRLNLANAVVGQISAEAKRDAMKAELVKLQDAASEMAFTGLDYRRAQLKLSVAEGKYRNLMERLEQARIQIEGVQGNAAVIDLAVDAKPTSSRTKLITYAILLSLVLGVGAVFVTEYLDDTLKTSEEMNNQVQLTPLGIIPRVKAVEQRLLSPDDQASTLFEAYRILRSGVRFASVNEPIRTLLVTSSMAAEGKSSTSVNLAIAMANGGQRVLLIDADLRNPTLHRLMGIEPEIGLTSVLLGEATLEEAILPTPYAGLSILPSGPVPPNPVELFESESMKELINELKVYAGMVIFDTAPVLPVTDASLLASAVDAVVMVLAAGEVTVDDARNARRILENAGARVIGGVLNKVRGGAEGYYGRYPYPTDGRGSGAGRKRLGRAMDGITSKITGKQG